MPHGGMMRDSEGSVTEHGPADRPRPRRGSGRSGRSGRDVTWLLDEIALPPGARVVELGCGPGGDLEELSARVGPTGSVIGVDRRALAVAQARRLVRERGLRNVEILQGDARDTGLAEAAFDLVTASLVLIIAPGREQIVAEAAALARPGGVVAFHEPDFVSHICHPPLPAWTRVVDVLGRYARLTGMDLHVARRLPHLLREAGLLDVQADPRVFVYPPGNGARAGLLDFVTKLADRIVAQKVITSAELTGLTAALDRHISDPRTLVVSDLFIQAWGRRPQSPNSSVPGC